MNAISIEQWVTLVACGRPVGSCSKCRGPLIGEEPIEAMGKVFLDARCASCGHETSAPGGRRLPARVVVPFRRRPVAWVDPGPDHAERAAGR